MMGRHRKGGIHESDIDVANAMGEWAGARVVLWPIRWRLLEQHDRDAECAGGSTGTCCRSTHVPCRGGIAKVVIVQLLEGR